MIVLDTVALIYWTTLPKLLTTAAERAIAEANSIVISSISIWEIAVKAQRGRMDLPVPFDTYYARLLKLENLAIHPVAAQTWITSAEFDWRHRDPADRVIVATATLLNCPLVTADKAIATFYPATVW